MVCVQDGGQEVDVLGDDLGASGVGVRHATHEGRQQTKLPTERAVQHDHRP